MKTPFRLASAVGQLHGVLRRVGTPGCGGSGAPVARMTLTAALVCAVALCVAAPASANFVSHGSFGGSELNTPVGVAVDQSNQAVYVGNLLFAGADKYDAQHDLASPPSPFATAGGDILSGTAVNPTNGQVYVVKGIGQTIDTFDPDTGAQLSSFSVAGSANQFGATVVQIASDAAGNVYLPNAPNNEVQKFDSSGTLLQTITGSGANALNAPTGVAVDAAGNVWVADTGNGRIEEFDSSGAFVGSEIASPGVQAVAVDPAGDVFASVTDGSGAHVVEYDAAGTQIDDFGLGTIGTSFGGTVNGIAFDDAAGLVYVADGGNNVIQVFGLPLPEVTTGSATNVAQTSVTLNGHIDPAGAGDVTSCQFEYGTTTSYGQTAPCSSAPPYSSPIDVSASLTGLEPNTDYHYRLSATSANGPGRGSDQTFTTSGPPRIASQSSSDVGKTTATLNAQINPDQFDTTYHFEYGTTPSYGTNIPVPDGDVGSGLGNQAVSAGLTGLEPGTTYYWRVVATNSQGTVHGADLTFTTLPVAQIDQEWTTDVGSTSATLHAQINPLGDATAYHFEWGTSTSYGTDIPVPDADIGSGSSGVSVSQPLTGLQPDVTYHWRVVATNAVGTIAGADHTFVYRSGAPFVLPDGRAYEQVSPVDKNDSKVGVWHGGLSGPGGDTVAYMGDGAFAGEPSNVPLDGNAYLAARSTGSWQTSPVNPPLNTDLGTLPPEGVVVGGSPDLTQQLVLSNVKLTPDGVEDNVNVYLHDSSDGSYRLVAKVPTAGLQAWQNDSLRSTGVFGGRAFLDTIRTALDVTPPPPAGAVHNLYEWSDGQLGLVGILPDGTVAPNGATMAQPGHLGDGCPSCVFSRTLFRPVSTDGTRVYWQEPAAEDGILARRIYLREGGQSRLVSQRQSDSSAQPAQFWYATPNGAMAYMTSNAPLTGDAHDAGGSPLDTSQGDLYRYDADADRLTDLTPKRAGEPGRANVASVLGTSDDGSYVYFLATGTLVPGATDGSQNLYVWHDGTTRLIGTLASDAAPLTNTLTQFPAAQVSPNGRYLAFLFGGRLDGPHAQSAQPASVVYLYDYQADSLGCASCAPTGEQPATDAVLTQGQVFGTTRRFLTNNGQVFFTTKDKLVAGDTNGADDVYEYEDGQPHLISTGRSDAGSVFSDVDPDGKNALFSTRERLVGQDIDNISDLYVARVGGGLPGQNPARPPVPCSGDQCQGSSGAPPAPTAASVSFSGLGNATPGARTPAVTTPKVKLLSHVVRGTRFLVKVRVPVKGRITLSGHGVRRVGRTVARAGTYRLRVTLTRSAGRTLGRRHTLKLRLRVGYAPASGRASSATVALTVKPATKAKEAHKSRAANPTRRAGR